MISAKLLKKFKEEAVKSLFGEWVVIGGAVLHALNIEERTTMDIDLARKSGGEDQTLELMKISEKLKLPVTTINQAGSFFLNKIENWKDNLILMAESQNCKLYRPNGTLFLLLKIQRMSESDLQDCLQMLKFCKKENEQVDSKLLKRNLQIAKNKSSEESILNRLKTLESALRA